MRLSFAVILAGLSISMAACAPTPRGAAPQAPAPSAISFKDFVTLESPAATAPTGDCGTDCQAYRQEFRYVVYVGKQVYCYWDEKKADTGTDFDALARSLELSITDSTRMTGYYQVLRLWASAFHDGHVNALMKPDTSDIDLYTAPFRLEVLAPGTDHEKVIMVDGSTTDLKTGDEVIAINGIPIADAVTAAEKIVSGSTRRMRRWASGRRLVDAMGVEAGTQDLTLTVKGDGHDRTVTIGRNVALTPKPGAGPAAAAAAPANDPTGADLVKATILPGGIAYLRIDGFSGTQMPFLLDSAMDRFAGTKGLLIDVRKNGGGDQSGNHVIARLASQDVTRYRTSERLSPYVLSQRPEVFPLYEQAGPDAPFALWHDLSVKASDRHYGGKVFVLTSPNCFSACDTFVSALKVNGLATVVGESTGGGTGTPLVVELPTSGMSFRYSTIRGHTAKDAVIEGNGTEVDVSLEPTVAERVTHQDKQLLAAVSLLQQAISAPAPQPSPALQAAIAALGAPPWAQSLDVAPTFADDLALHRIAGIDELQ